jgi:hypothetical protein
LNADGHLPGWTGGRPRVCKKIDALSSRRRGIGAARRRTPVRHDGSGIAALGALGGRGGTRRESGFLAGLRTADAGLLGGPRAVDPRHRSSSTGRCDSAAILAGVETEFDDGELRHPVSTRGTSREFSAPEVSDDGELNERLLKASFEDVTFDPAVRWIDIEPLARLSDIARAIKVADDDWDLADDLDDLLHLTVYASLFHHSSLREQIGARGLRGLLLLDASTALSLG